MVLPGLELSWLREIVFSLPILAKGGGKGGGGKGGKGGSPPKPPALPPPPPPLPPPPTPEDPAVAQARKDAEEAARKAKGRRSLITNIGGAEGDLSAAPTQAPTLLGDVAGFKSRTGS